MRRRSFLTLVAGGMLNAPAAIAVKAAERVHRIGMLDVIGQAPNAANLSALRGALAGLGYVEGHNLVIEYRSCDGRTEHLPDLAIELVRLEVDVLMTRGYPASLAARRATGTIPIVMIANGDPAAGSGILSNLARPGENVTGLQVTAPPELGGRRLRLLKEAVPGTSRVGVLWNPGDLHPMAVMRHIETAARAMRIQLKSLEVQRSWDFERAFEAAMLAQIDALIAVEDFLTVSDRTRIAEFAATARLPAIYGLRDFAQDGGLLAYGTDRRDLFRRSATYVHRVLRGARPADLPVEQPTKFELVVNLKTAKALALKIPQSLLAQADEVIQ